MDFRKPPPGPRTVLPPDVAKAMGMTETERLQLAAGTLPMVSLSDLIRELEAEFGTGDDTPTDPTEAPQ